MINRRRFMLHGLLPLVAGCSRTPEPTAFPQDWDSSGAMRGVARRFTGKPGVALHVGDSITLDPAYAAWPLSGGGRSAHDEALLRWMHTGTRDERDGWSLCSTPAGSKRSATAFSGIRLEQLLAGQRFGVRLASLLAHYRPQVVVFLIGTNDATVGRSEDDFATDLKQAVSLITAHGTVPVLSTLPPHARKPVLAQRYNARIQDLARQAQLPLIDFCGEIVRRRPKDWNGTLMERNDLHPTAGPLPAAEPTETDLARSGYLLRAWLSVRKLAEVKAEVFDPVAAN